MLNSNSTTDPGAAAPLSPVALFLRDACQDKLLNHQEEIDLAQRIQAGSAAETKLPQCRAAARRRALQAQVEDGRQACAELVTRNTRLVVSVAKRYRGHGVEFADLIQEGNLGLIKAAGRFDPGRGYRFSTFATWWVRQGVQRAVLNHGRTIRLPAHVSEKLRDVARQAQALEQRLGRAPTLAELAEASALTEPKLAALLRANQTPLSLETPLDEEASDSAEFGESVADAEARTPDQAAAQQLADQVASVLQCLDDRERAVLSMRFGLDGDGGRVLEEVAMKIGLTRERVRQIEAAALRKLRHPSLARRLQGLAQPD